MPIMGKIYSVLAHQMAARICESVFDLEEVHVWLCRQIGQPLAEPWSVAVEFFARPGLREADMEPAIQQVISAELSGLPAFIERLTRGELAVC
jgi:S-adenosylmethionine synthetase